MTHVELTVLGVAAPQLPPHIKSGICEDPDTGCWLWLKSRSRDGYGWTSLGDKTYQAHRLVYRLLAGEPPEGTVLDHLCRVRHCVNPAHLEPVTPGENLRRSELTPAGKVLCGSGHGPLSRLRGQRRCLECLREYEESRLVRKRDMERARRARLRGAS